MSTTFVPEKNQIIYKPTTIDSDSDCDETIDVDVDVDKSLLSISNCNKIIRINSKPNEIDYNTQLKIWQQLIKDPTLSDLDDIIDQLDTLFKEALHSKNGNFDKYKSALLDAQKIKFNNLNSDRQKMIIKKDINKDQFNKRIVMDYDKKELDGQCKIIVDGRLYHKNAAAENKLDDRPAPKNWGTKPLANFSKFRKPMFDDLEMMLR